MKKNKTITVKKCFRTSQSVFQTKTRSFYSENILYIIF